MVIDLRGSWAQSGMHRRHGRDLADDLQRLRFLQRRQLLKLGLALPLLGCGSTLGGGSTADGACSTIPEETAGPYPGDGSNGVNALSLEGILRTDLRSSFGSMSGTAAGIPLTVTLTLVGTDVSCAPLSGYGVYLWHCDRDGHYSLYTVTNQNYLRGLAATDENGQVSFTTIFPACYSGRWPHIHFEVYPNVTVATDSSKKVKTSQLALPEATCDEVYATSGYEASVQNLASTSLQTDNVFGDGSSLQVATLTGDPASGYVATLQVGVPA